MFYVIYDLRSNPAHQMHIYTSIDELNKDWLNKFKEYCAKSNTDPVELGARCEIIPISEEDEVSYEPVEVKSFANWKVETLNDKEKLKEFLFSNFSL